MFVVHEALTMHQHHPSSADFGGVDLGDFDAGNNSFDLARYLEGGECGSGENPFENPCSSTIDPSVGS